MINFRVTALTQNHDIDIIWTKIILEFYKKDIAVYF